MNLEEKAKRIKTLKEDIDSYNEEIRTMQEERSVLVEELQELSSDVEDFMLEGNFKSVKTGKMSISIIKSSYVEVYDEDSVPDEYKYFVKKVNKTILRSELKNKSVPGVKISRRNHIKVK